MRAPTIPVTPSRAEVLQHRLKHHPFRSWCPQSVRGKGREDRHLRSTQKDEYQGPPKLASDYFFIGRRRPNERKEREADEEEAAKDEDLDNEDLDDVEEEEEDEEKTEVCRESLCFFRRWNLTLLFL